MATNKHRMVACPQCQRLAEFSSANRYRPFCSERCRLIDLGQWASESYRIPDKSEPDDLDGQISENHYS